MKFRATPAWTLLPRRTEKIEASALGPGAYNPRLTRTSLSYGIGSSKRSDFTKGATAPGPGTYEHSSRPESARTV